MRLYERIYTALESPESKQTLERLVEEEARALRGFTHPRTSTRVDATTRQQAEDFYAEDILRFLQADPARALTEVDVLAYRRRAPAWAMAEVLRRLGVTPSALGADEVAPRARSEAVQSFLVALRVLCEEHRAELRGELEVRIGEERVSGVVAALEQLAEQAGEAD